MTKGYTQSYGIDYLETFAPMARMTKVRILIALAAKFGWKLQQFDVKNAFLHEDLKEEVFMEIPPSFTHEGDGKTQVWKIFKDHVFYGIPPKSRRPHSIYQTYRRKGNSFACLCG